MKMIPSILVFSTLIIGSVFGTEASPKESIPLQKTTTDVHLAYPYVSLGLGPAPIPLPVFGAGYRFQRGHHGLDVSADVATVYWATGVKASLLYQYYFTPNPASQFYMGVGPCVGVGFLKECMKRPEIAGALAFAFGKEYTNENGERRFFQADIDFPVVTDKKPYVYPIPVVVVKYGIGF